MIWKIWKKNKLNRDKIWKIWKKSQLNSEMIWKIWKKGKLKCEMIWKKCKSNSEKIWVLFLFVTCFGWNFNPIASAAAALGYMAATALSVLSKSSEDGIKKRR
jgi:hypothetical protein